MQPRPDNPTQLTPKEQNPESQGSIPAHSEIYQTQHGEGQNQRGLVLTAKPSEPHCAILSE